MFQITQYASAEEPNTQKQITLTEALQIIQRGDENLNLIQKARTFAKGSRKYDVIKKTLLPTFRFNFLFDGSASNDNISTATGLIYLDADGLDALPSSPYIHASWKSLSDTGFGILVKVDNLTTSNYKYVYNELTEIILIETDAGARKATQQTIQSYDPNLYHNPDSSVFHFQDKVSHAPILEKRKKCIGTNDTLNNWNEEAIRFNNIGSYFTDDTPYLVFKEKEWICNPFIPIRIEQGKRNNTMFFLLSQYALLNPNTGKSFLVSIAGTINKHMFPHLSENEINSIAESVVNRRNAGNLSIHYNEERRFLFNPAIRLTQKEKMLIVNQESGKLKSQYTRELIYTALENWEFENDGPITQKKVSAKAGRGIATIKRYWNEFKDYVQTLNSDFQQLQLTDTIIMGISA